MTESVLSNPSHGGRERDIDLVLIAGAGASREFGLQGKKLPLMGDWSEEIIHKMSQKNASYLNATGLQRGMSGEQFEAQLGRFLHQVEAFPLIESLLDTSTRFQGLQNPALQAQGALKEWHSQAVFHLQQIVEGIRESLYEEFAENGIDSYRAAEVYGKLFQAVRLSGGTRWVYATTNYDVIAETVIERLGALPDWGQPQRTDAVSEAPLVVSNNPEQPDSSATNVLQTIRSRLGNAGIIPLRFGTTDEASSASGEAAIEQWGEGLSNKGFL